MRGLLILLSALVLAAAWLARWWFWWRIRDQGRRTECSMSVSALKEALGFPPKKEEPLRDAAALGSAMRECGLRLLEADGLAIARRRRTGWWSLRILPGLLLVVLVFAAVSRWMPLAWAIAVAMLILAFHVLARASGLAVELRAVARAREELDKRGGFHRLSEEEAVITCARASAWDSVLPW